MAFGIHADAEAATFPFGLISQSIPLPGGAGVQAGVTGRQYFTRIYLPTATITNVHCGVRVGGATFTNTNTLAIWTAAGSKVAETADLATTFNTTGYKSIAWTSPYAATAGYFYIGWITSASTNPSLLANGFDATANIAASLNTSSSRLAYANTTVRTAWPASYTFSSETASNTVIWFGVS